MHSRDPMGDARGAALWSGGRGRPRGGGASSSRGGSERSGELRKEDGGEGVSGLCLLVSGWAVRAGAYAHVPVRVPSSFPTLVWPGTPSPTPHPASPCSSHRSYLPHHLGLAAPHPRAALPTPLRPRRLRPHQHAAPPPTPGAARARPGAGFGTRPGTRFGTRSRSRFGRGARSRFRGEAGSGGRGGGRVGGRFGRGAGWCGRGGGGVCGVIGGGVEAWAVVPM